MGAALLQRAERLLRQVGADPVADGEANRRMEERVSCRILLTTISVDPHTGRPVARMVPAWSVDVSKSGAAIVTRDELSYPRLYLKFLLPGAGAKCLECEVMNGAVLDEFQDESGRFYRYGVSFVRTLSEAELYFALESIEGRRSE